MDKIIKKKVLDVEKGEKILVSWDYGDNEEECIFFSLESNGVKLYHIDQHRTNCCDKEIVTKLNGDSIFREVEIFNPEYYRIGYKIKMNKSIGEILKYEESSLRIKCVYDHCNNDVGDYDIELIKERIKCGNGYIIDKPDYEGFKKEIVDLLTSKEDYCAITARKYSVKCNGNYCIKCNCEVITKIMLKYNIFQ